MYDFINILHLKILNYAQSLKDEEYALHMCAVLDSRFFVHHHQDAAKVCIKMMGARNIK